jgi:hypothetical protein
MKLGIAANVHVGTKPINGLRHPPEGDTTGWYIWAGGEITQDDPNFFAPIHVEHLKDRYPGAIKYLAVPPGWRFLITDDYEDVWQDPSLLKIPRMTEASPGLSRLDCPRATDPGGRG